jgi:hypothetical protein
MAGIFGLVRVGRRMSLLAFCACREELTKIQAAYNKEMRARRKIVQAARTASNKPSLKKQKLEKQCNFDSNAKMCNIMTTCREYFYDSSFEGKLNCNKDVLPAANGVIHLRSGLIVPHHPKVNTRF